MPPILVKKKHPLWRRLLRRLGELAVVGLALLLVLQIFLWWCLRQGKQLTLPEYAVEALREAFADSGIACHFHEVHIRLGGYFEIEGLELGSPGSEAPHLTVNRAIATLNFPALLRGKIAPKRILIDGGTFYCPASASPDGRRQAVLRDMRASLAQESRWILVETLQARFGDMPIVLHGQFLPLGLFDRDESLPFHSSSAAEPVSSADWHALNKIAAQMLRVRAELEAVGKLSLNVEGQGDDTGAVRLSVLARGDTFALPGNARALDAQLTSSILFDGKAFHPGHDSVLTVRSAEWADAAIGLSIKTGPLRFVSRFGPNWEKPVRGAFTACGVEINGERVDYARGTARWDKFPQIETTAQIVEENDFITASAQGDWRQRDLAVSFSARLTPTRYLNHPKLKPFIPEELDSLAFHQQLKLDGSVNFAPGGKFTETRFQFDTGAVRFAGFRLLSGTGRLHLTPDRVELTDADLRAANYGARGSFFTGFSNASEYRFLLHGSIDPHLLDEFLGRWWKEIWSEFSLKPLQLPHADIEIHGQWGLPHEFIYCAAVGQDLQFRGKNFDQAELRIVELPTLLALFDMQVWQQQLSALGSLQWHYLTEPSYRLHSLRFKFDGTLPKDTAVALAGEGLPERLAPLKLEKPPQLTVTGYYHDKASATPGREQVMVRATAPGAITAWNLPFSDFNGTVAYDTGQLVVTVDDATFAEGKIGSKPSPWSSERPTRPQRAWVDLRPADPLLQIDVEMLQARRTLFFDHLARLGENYQPPAPATTPDTSRMDLRFLGSMTLPKLETLDGTGHLLLHDPSLPHLHIFGGLSRVLDKMGLGLTSFALDQAESDFTIRENIVYVPNGKITGPDAEIDTVGRYNLDDDSLKFRAILTVKAGDKVPLLGSIMKVINRIPRLTPVNITGTLEKPEWRVDPTPSALLQRSLDEKEGRPPE